MEPPPMETVYQAISALYDNPNASEKEKASNWLGDIQKSIHSWKIADDLLQQKKDIHSCYFAAQTMRSKVQNNLSELPPEAVLSLRNALIVHLEGITSETNNPILTQLCLALADLSLQTPTWHNCVTDLINAFANKNNLALLEILTVLPQEIDSPTLKLGENRREEVKAELRATSHGVTEFLKESLANSQSSSLALKIVKCMTSWIHVRAFNMQEVPQNAVIGFSLQILRDHSSINLLHDAALDCICGLLHCLEESNSDENVGKLLFDSVVALEESYHMAVAMEEEVKVSNFARLFTELAESFLEKIVVLASRGETHFSMRSLELALLCVGHHDYEVAEISFNLWYRLSEEVYQRDYPPLQEVFKPHIERLIAALARHCQCEPDTTQLPDTGHEFYEFRMKVMELIKDVVFIVGSSSVFKQMFSALLQPADGAAAASWEQTEAALFIMQCVARNIIPEEYEYVPKVIEAILSMPPTTHVAVRKTCMSLLGELCEWIERHPECLEACLETLIDALADQALSGAAALALQNICKASRSSCGAHVGRLLAAQRRALPPAAAAALARAAAAALGTLPPDQLSEAMREAVSIQTTALTQLMSSGLQCSRGGPGDPVPWLDRLAALFRDVEADAGTDSLRPALHLCWPVLRQAMDKYGCEGRVMERWCRCCRYMSRGARGALRGLLPEMAQCIQLLYARAPHSALLYLASVLVDELSSEPSCVPELIGLLNALVPRALTLLHGHQLKDHPDTVDDLFRLCVRFLQRIPLEFLSSSAMCSVLQCALLGAALDHRDANSSVMKFLYDLARAANAQQGAQHRMRVRELAEQILRQYGEELTFVLLEASVVHLHPYMLSEVAEVLMEIQTWVSKSWADGGAGWVRAALRRLPRGPPAATPAQQDHFQLCALRATKCKEMTKLLGDFAKLYR